MKGGLIYRSFERTIIGNCFRILQQQYRSIAAPSINSFHRRRAGQIFVKSQEAKSLVNVSRLSFWSLSCLCRILSCAAWDVRFTRDSARWFDRLSTEELNRTRWDCVSALVLSFSVLLNRVSNDHLNMINEPYGHYASKSKIDALSKSDGVIRSTFSGDNVSASSFSSFVQQQHRVSLNSPRTHHRRGEKRRVRLSRTKRSGSTVIFTTQEPWV